jgi:murein DD-endopeptidase MepM/ murein hydrolase activator NlpD
MTQKQYLIIGASIAASGLAVYFLLQARKMLMPVDGSITSPFGLRKNPISGDPEFHNGIDIQAAEGTPIVAPAAGLVINVFSNDKGGNQMLIKHDNGYTTGYAHLSAYEVKQGDRVSKGQLIALVGTTGNSTGAHLHLTLKDKNGVTIDPQNYFA